MTLYERWALICSLASLVVSIVAFGALAWQLVMLAQATKLDHVRRRKQATVEYMSVTMDKLAQFGGFGVPDARDQAAIASLVERAVAGDGEAIRMITGYLTIFNYLGVAAHSDAFDLEIINQARGGTVIAVAENYRPWITFQREKTHEPRLYEDLEWLASRMTPRRVPTRGTTERAAGQVQCPTPSSSDHAAGPPSRSTPTTGPCTRQLDQRGSVEF